MNIYSVYCVRMLKEVQKGHFLGVMHLHLKNAKFSTEIKVNGKNYAKSGSAMSQSVLSSFRNFLRLEN